MIGMINTKVLAVLVVVLVAAAGIGAVLLLSGGEGKYRSADDTGRLMIFGNANNDDYLDRDDIETLEKIIEGNVEETPLADANQDGVVDQKDIEFVEKMLRQEKMTIYYQYRFSGEPMIGSVKYPIERACVVGTNALVTVKAIGATDKVVCIYGTPSNSPMDPVLFSDMVNLPKVSTSSFEADTEEVSKYNVGTIITQDSASYVDNEALFIKAGVDVVRIAASDGLESLAGILTVGYLTQNEKRAQEYVKFCDDILAELEKKVGADAMDDADRVTTLSVTMTNYVGGLPSDYYAATQLAGAKNLADWDKTTQQFKLDDEWLLVPKYQADFIVHARSIGYGEVDLQETWDLYSKYFTEMNAYKEGHYVILNGNMPVSIRLAYMASLYYPEIFGADWGSNIHQEYIDRFMDNLHESGYDVNEDGTFLITKNMVNA